MTKKFRLSAIFNGTSSSSPAGDEETKKQNRRSFSLATSLKNLKEGKTKSESSSNSSDSTAEGQSTSRMAALAQQIARDTEKLEAYMRENDLPIPTSDVDSPSQYPKLPEDIQRLKQDIIAATRELNRLAHGPQEYLRWGVWAVSIHFPSWGLKDAADMTAVP